MPSHQPGSPASSETRCGRAGTCLTLRGAGGAFDRISVRTDRGVPAFEVHGTADWSERDPAVIVDTEHRPVARLVERVSSAGVAVAVRRPEKPVATIRRAMSGYGIPRWLVHADDVGDLTMDGDVWSTGAALRHGENVVAEVRDRGRRELVVTVAGSFDVVLALSVVVAAARLQP